MKIGLTGGVASGKSTVAEMFAELGVQVIDTDVIARQVVEPGEPALAEIRNAFGAAVLDAEGRLDRKAMRSIVFSDPTRRRELERILHPRIRAAAEKQSAAARGRYHIIVVPLLAESPMKHDMDRILVVDCDEDVQLERLLARDIETGAQARRMISAQASREERLSIADDVIDNGAGLQSTREQVRLLHEKYLSLAGDRQEQSGHPGS